VEDLTQILKEQVSLHVPLIKDTKTRGKRLSKHIQKLIRKRVEAWQKYQQYKGGKNFAEYKRIRNDVNSAIREEKYSRKPILKSFPGNPKRFYGYMRRMQTVKDTVTAIRKDDG